MRILLTNDDGIGSEGIQALLRALGADHEVWVVAPEAEKSLDPVAAHAVVVGEQDPHARCILFSMIRAPADGLQMYSSGWKPKIRS